MELVDVFLENAFIPLYGLTVIIAIWRYQKYFDTPLKFLPILVMYTFLTELLGELIASYDQISLFISDLYLNYNWVIYNIYNLVFFLYFYYVFWNYINRKSYKRIILIGAILLVITSIINAFMHSFLLEPQVFAYVVGSIFLIMACLFYITKLRTTYNQWFLKRNLVSWISLGLLIFYMGYLPIKIMRYYNALYGFNDVPAVRRLHLLLILLMYCCFIIGFLLMRRRSVS